MIKLSQLFIHPVKSMRGLQLSHAQVLPSGLAFDRIFMLTDRFGKFITARKFPQMVRFTPALVMDGIVITADDNRYITVKFSDFTQEQLPTEVWNNHFTAHIAPEQVNAWLSDYLAHPVQLRWVGAELSRRVKRFPDMPLSFADGYPFLLINQASFAVLQQRCSTPISLPQFRPNLVIDGALAFAEDSWKTVRIGEVIFDVVKPCSRCILTTVNIETGKPHPLGEPLSTLKQFRTADNGDVDFGQNLIARNRGVVRVGDSIEILETQPARSYIAHPAVDEDHIIDSVVSSSNPVTIEFEGVAFEGNTNQVILEQLEQQGINIPYSCRAGICGHCRVSLNSGEVLPLSKGALKNNASILACSCIPKSNIKLSLG